MDDSKRYLYRGMVNAARSPGRPGPAFFEMCAAGWLPATTDLRCRIINNPFFGREAYFDGIYEEHFVAMLGEPIPTVSHTIHPLDTDDLRWRLADRGVLAPVPRSVAGRAMSHATDDNMVQDPQDAVIEAAVAKFFPNWKIIGREYFEPKKPV
jgi:hypothetical protein